MIFVLLVSLVMRPVDEPADRTAHPTRQGGAYFLGSLQGFDVGGGGVGDFGVGGGGVGGFGVGEGGVGGFGNDDLSGIGIQHLS